MIEIVTIGAGGGSIARIDAGGFLHVGPESAGAEPGPVCYGAGNLEPTLTDANLVLGRINAGRPIGGKLDRLDVDGARHAIAQAIGDPLGLGVEAAAEAILRVANAKMAGAIRLVSIERGHDPQVFYAMPFGGGGALHAGALIRDCGLKGAIVPRYPGVTSALGCIVADMRHDRVKTVNTLAGKIDAELMFAEMRGVEQELRRLLETSGVTFDGIETTFELDMLYVGQTHTVTATLDAGEGSIHRGQIEHAFDQAYLRNFGRLLDGIPRRIMNYRVAVIGRRPAFDLAALGPPAALPAAECVTGSREVYCDGAWQSCPVYDRLLLEQGAEVSGPALLEQSDATIFIDPGLRGWVDALWNLVIEKPAGKTA